MTATGIPVLAGTASTIIFAASVLPMVVKARRTRDLRSYSRGNLVLANLGNGVHSVYVYDLPRGPIWVLHGFYVVTSALMLLWSVRYGRTPGCGPPRAPRVGCQVRPDDSAGIDLYCSRSSAAAAIRAGYRGQDRGSFSRSSPTLIRPVPEPPAQTSVRSRHGSTLRWLMDHQT